MLQAFVSTLNSILWPRRSEHLLPLRNHGFLCYGFVASPPTIAQFSGEIEFQSEANGELCRPCFLITPEGFFRHEAMFL